MTMRDTEFLGKPTNRTDAAAPEREQVRSSSAWRGIQEEFLATGRAAPLHRALTQAVDAVVVEAFQASIAPVFPQAALLALGGFGRGELFPYSDLDIVILHEAEPPPALREALADFARLLWESGLRPNQRRCTVDECLELGEASIDLNINLLDRRLLAGDREVHAKLERSLPGFLAKHGEKLARRLCQLTRARHEKYQNTPYQAQPDVKESPGGIRDLHLIGRLAKLGLEQAGSGEALAEASEFLSAVRCFLHYRSEGDCNILDFAAQQAIREQPFAGNYFQNARLVFNEARRGLEAAGKDDSPVFESVRDWQAKISNAEFTALRERVFLRRPAEIESDPTMVFRLFEFVARHGVPPAAETERRLEAARGSLAAFCAQPQPLWPILKTILSLPHAAMALRTLRDLDLLAAVVPAWTNFEGQVAADGDHRHTAGEHTLVTIERIGELRNATDPSRQRFSVLLSEIDDPEVLLFALLFRDAGKEAAVRVQMPAGAQDAVEFLISRRLDLSDAVSGRDLDNPATARLLANAIGTIERLKQLAVLTYAETAASHPESLIPWRMEQLWRTYLVAQRELMRELETDRIQDLPQSLPAGAEFLKGFPVRYLRARTAGEIEAHLRLYELSRPTGVAVQIERLEGAYKLTVVARDIPFLFASLAGAITSFGLDILKAEAFSNSKGLVLDTFVLADPQRTLELNPPEIERLEDLIRRVGLGKTDARRLLRNRAQADPKKRSFDPQVRFDSEACETATLVEIVTEDRSGLLYGLATVFSSTGCNIDVVLIDTKGKRAIDVFYVAHEGGKLSPELQAALREKLVAAC